MITERLNEVRTRILRAKETGTNSAEHVKLIAVSKTFPLEQILAAAADGQQCFGESKVQEFTEKFNARPDLEWHLIGHLQTNKVRNIIGKTALIHSLDRLDLAKELEKRSANADLCTHCLVQVNIAEEETKSGLLVPELSDFLDAMADFPHLRIDGLMTIGPHTDDMIAVRQCFAKLRELRDREKAVSRPNSDLRELSMGMSTDFEIAVEEGATLLRVGSLIFGERDYSHVR